MIASRTWRGAVAPALGLALVLVPAAAAPAATVASPAALHRVPPEPPAADAVRTELDALTVEAPHSMAGYSPAKFPHWIKQYGECDTREVVLSRDGSNVTQDSTCRATSGSWSSPYDDKTLDSASKVAIDHMVPLANAWRSGADTWTTDRRQAFANDLDNPQLYAVSAASHRAKGDRSPDRWSPPNQDFWCTYSRSWGHIKSLYKLSVTQPEKETLIAMLDTCN